VDNPVSRKALRITFSRGFIIHKKKCHHLNLFASQNRAKIAALLIKIFIGITKFRKEKEKIKH
jgi:hypothetical protein